MPKQNPTSCDWCGKFIVLQGYEEIRAPWKAFEIMRDEEGRILQAYDGTLIVAQEHRCKVRCSACGDLLIFDSGGLYERASTESNSHHENDKRPHQCRQKRSSN
ncbi:MAG TPA: hypothetical protein VFF30_06805 [Nitrososphaerales archaeon]|nr:hypothetical protein [Nitrososphaerales archaeon]